MNQLDIARDLAYVYNDGQMYGENDYSFHLFDVADMVWDWVVDTWTQERIDTVMAIAWNHDLIEDTDCTYAKMMDAGLSLEVIVAVEALTKVKGESYEDYISRVRANALALFVKKADTLCNLTQSLKEGNVYRIMKYTKQLQLLTEE